MTETNPIPPLYEPPDWARLPIVECGEPLVPVASGEGRVVTRALYAEQGIPGAPTTAYVRSGVRSRLLLAAASLPEGVSLLLFDGHRPLAVQRFLWDTYFAEIARRRPELSDDAIAAQVRQFVASPTPDPAAPPPHRTGGAVDVYLVETDTGRPLPMGTEPDEASPASVTRHFEEHPAAPFTENRRLLFHAMTGAGFTNYLGEWWHYDFGNQRWANCAGAEHAVYGIASEPNEP